MAGLFSVSVVVAAVPAPGARALDERGDPPAAGALDGRLDARQPGAQAEEAGDALEARGARDADADGTALVVAEAEAVPAPVDRDDGALELPRGRARGGGRDGRNSGEGADGGDQLLHDNSPQVACGEQPCAGAPKRPQAEGQASVKPREAAH